MEIFTLISCRKLAVAIFTLLVFFMHFNLSAQIPISYRATSGIPDSVLVKQILIGQGIETSNITSSGNVNSRGKFIGTSNIGIYSGVILASGHVKNSEGPNDTGSKETQFNTPGDPVLQQLAGNGQPSRDASILEFDFIPQSNKVEFRYVFASEEYPEFSSPTSNFNDVFGFFISGPGIVGEFPSPPGFPGGAINIATLPNVLQQTYVAIQSINNGTQNNGPCVNCNYYVNNGTGTTPQDNPYIQYDGFTTVLTAKADVIPCQTYHIKLSISDIGDAQYDSGVFLEANSFSSVGLGSEVAFTHAEVDTAVEACNNANIEFIMFDVTPVDYVIELEISGTAQNGVDYETIPSQVIIPAGSTSTVLTINPIEDLELEDTETVKLKYNASLCPSSAIYDSVIVYIKDLRPFSSSASSDMTINCEDTIDLVAYANGGQEPYYYSWNTGETNDTLTVSPPNSVQFTVSVSDICGQTEVHDINIEVIGPEAKACDDVSLCNGNETTLSVQGGTSWHWESDPYDNSLIDPSVQNPVVKPAVTTTYTVTVYDNCGNEDTDEVTVFVGELHANAGDDVTICDGQTATLTAQPSGNLNYVWRDASNVIVGYGQTVNVSPLSDMTYTVTISDAACTTLSDSDEVTVFVTNMTVTVSSDATICAGDKAILTASSSLGGGTFIWSDGVNSYPGQTIEVKPDVTTVYTVTVDDGCIKDGPPVTVTVNQLPNVLASAPVTSICPDESVTLTASGAISYQWTSTDPSLVGQEYSLSPTVAPTVTSTYTLTGTDGNSCVNTDNITIYVKDRMYATFNLSDSGVCEGEDLTITYTGNASALGIYDWNFDGGMASGSGQGPYQVHWSTAGTKNISLTVTGNSCVSEPVTHTIEVSPMPIADFTHGITEGCVPLEVDFTDASTNTIPGVTYKWDFGTGNTSNEQSPIQVFNEPGLHTVSLTVTNLGCSNTMTVPSLIDAWPVPAAGIDANPIKVSMKNPVITFNSTSIGDELTYEWLTGDGNTYDVAGFTHTYADSGIYQVQLTTNNKYGCSNTALTTVFVTPRYMLKIPSAFTPNGDGLNDNFTVRGNGVKQYRITIYDKWGRLIWESNDIYSSWDGKINGQPPVSGVYMYHTFFMDDNDEVSEQSGSFVILK